MRLADVVLLALCLTLTACDSTPLMDLRGHTNLLVTLGLSIHDDDYAGVALDITMDGERYTLPVSGLYDHQAPRPGPLEVDVALRRGGEVLATDSFTLEVAQSDVQWVHGHVGGTRPDPICDLPPVRGVPIEGSATDSLFIAYGRLPHGITSC